LPGTAGKGKPGQQQGPEDASQNTRT